MLGDYITEYGIAGEELPIAVTRKIGHGTDSKGILIGRKLTLL